MKKKAFIDLSDSDITLLKDRVNKNRVKKTGQYITCVSCGTKSLKINGKLFCDKRCSNHYRNFLRSKKGKELINKTVKKPLSRHKKKMIREMFWGSPRGVYKDEWKDENGIVDNRCSTIAKRLKLSTGKVSVFLDKEVEDHFYKVNKFINNGNNKST